MNTVHILEISINLQYYEYKMHKQQESPLKLKIQFKYFNRNFLIFKLIFILLEAMKMIIALNFSMCTFNIFNYNLINFTIFK